MEGGCEENQGLYLNTTSTAGEVTTNKANNALQTVKLFTPQKTGVSSPDRGSRRIGPALAPSEGAQSGVPQN